jgi:hypothetical protein
MSSMTYAEHLAAGGFDILAEYRSQLETAKQALKLIADRCPATQDMTLAHEMAQIAEDALELLK